MVIQLIQDSNKHAPAECPRCGRLFACKQNTAHKCDCVKVSLSREEIQFIKEEMLDETDCLCMICLDDLKLLHKIKT